MRSLLLSLLLIIPLSPSAQEPSGSANTDPLSVPVCEKPVRGYKMIGFGKYGIQFRVPVRVVKILGGKPDADYVAYVIMPKAGKSHLEFWFGPYAMGLDPPGELFLDSVGFEQRAVVAANDGIIGKDTWGHLRNGNSWRQAAVGGEGGARYRDASPKDASLFNQIIDSMCEVPYPSQ